MCISKDMDKICRETLEKVKSYFNNGLKDRRKESVSGKKIYCYICCRIHKIPLTLACYHIGLDHSTVSHHLESIKKDEIDLAIKINNKNNYERKENPYEKTGFRYNKN